MTSCSSAALARALGALRVRWTERAPSRSGGGYRHVLVHPDDHEAALGLLRDHALHRIDATGGSGDPTASDWYGADADTATLLHVRLRREAGGEGERTPGEARSVDVRPGPVIALIGCDGSGKSSVSRWLTDTLDDAFGARFVYFGTGDGPGSALLRTLNVLKRRSRYGEASSGTAAGEIDGADGADVPGGAGRVPNSLRLLWAAVVARERHAKLRHVERVTRRGLCVVTDRYPQAEVAGVHDGPRLGHLLGEGPGGFGRALARREQALYERFAQRVPERVLLLDVPLEVALRRRPEETPATLSRRIAIARSLRFGGARRAVVDASRTLPEVQTEVLGHALETLAR